MSLSLSLSVYLCVSISSPNLEEFEDRPELREDVLEVLVSFLGLRIDRVVLAVSGATLGGRGLLWKRCLGRCAGC